MTNGVIASETLTSYQLTVQQAQDDDDQWTGVHQADVSGAHCTLYNAWQVSQLVATGRSGYM